MLPGLGMRALPAIHEWTFIVPPGKLGCPAPAVRERENRTSAISEEVNLCMVLGAT